MSAAIIGHRELAEDCWAFTIAVLELPDHLPDDCLAFGVALADALEEGYAADQRAVEVPADLAGDDRAEAIERANRNRVKIWARAIETARPKMPARLANHRAWGDLASRIHSRNLRRPENLLAMQGKPYAVVSADGRVVESGPEFGE